MFCGTEHCGICDIGKAPIFTMRGLCPKSKFDFHYGWDGIIYKESHDKIFFRGFSKSSIFWDPVNSNWRLENNKNSSIYAINNSTKGPYPFGTNKWFVFNDIECGKRFLGDNYQAELSFTSCDGEKFNCHDGTW